MAPSIGPMVGGVLLGSGRQAKHPMRLIVAPLAAEGLFVMGLGGSVLVARGSVLAGFGVAMVVLFGAGVADVLNNVPRTTIVQMRTPDELRGRVSALMSVFSSRGPQLDQVEMGGLAVALGPALGPVVSGLLATAIPLVCLIPKRLRHDVASFTLDAGYEPPPSARS